MGKSWTIKNNQQLEALTINLVGAFLLSLSASCSIIKLQEVDVDEWDWVKKAIEWESIRDKWISQIS